MRFSVALLAGILLLGLGPASAQSPSAWSYAYQDGWVTATERNAEGEVTAMFSCRPPDGELEIADYELKRSGNVRIQIGDFAYETRGRVERARDGRRALIVRMEQSPPVLAGGYARNAQMTLTVGNRSRTLSPGGGARIHEVAVACWNAT